MLQVFVVVAALGLAVWPPRKTPLQLAAFTAALLMAFELTLTHWTATYVVWFFPFALLATLAGRALAGDSSASEGTPYRYETEPVAHADRARPHGLCHDSFWVSGG